MKAFFRRIFCTLAATLTFSLVLAQPASSSTAKIENINDILANLEKTLKKGNSASERLAAAVVLAPLQEQIGLYAEAGTSYSTGASLAGVQTMQGQNLLLGAVRCSLAAGDVSSADFLLSTAFGFTASSEVKATTKLYALWSWIIKAETKAELAGPISVLRSYVAAPDMISVKPALLLTLYHITNDQIWASQLQKEFSNSPEASVSLGDARLLPAPFWFFISD